MNDLAEANGFKTIEVLLRKLNLHYINQIIRCGDDSIFFIGVDIPSCGLFSPSNEESPRFNGKF